MIERKETHGAMTRVITVYEPGDIVPDGVNVIPYRDRLMAQKGDYVTDMNGFMIPCRRRQKTKRGTFFVFPRFAWFPEKYPDFIYPVWRLSEAQAPPGLPATYQAVLRIVSTGEDLLTAALVVFKGLPLNVAWRKTLKMFNSDQFLDALVHQGGYMSKLRERLLAKGITEERIADEIVQIIEDDDPKKSNLRKWALEQSMKILDEKPGRRVPDGAERYDEEDELDKLISTSSPSLELLPPRASAVEVDTTSEPSDETAQLSGSEDLHE